MTNITATKTVAAIPAQVRRRMMTAHGLGGVKNGYTITSLPVRHVHACLHTHSTAHQNWQCFLRGRACTPSNTALGRAHVVADVQLHKVSCTLTEGPPGISPITCISSCNLVHGIHAEVPAFCFHFPFPPLFYGWHVYYADINGVVSNIRLAMRGIYIQSNNHLNVAIL